MHIAILGEGAPPQTEQLLRRNGFCTVWLPRNPHLPAPVAGHPDLSVFFAPDAVFTTKRYAVLAQRELAAVCRHIRLPLRTVTAEVGDRYPHDVLLDALPVGRRLFCLPDATAHELTCHPGYRIIPVRQGYAKCAALPVGSNALASADPSILIAAEREGLETFALSPGGIRLSGYSTGFIGGAASCAPYESTDAVFFCGDPQLHPDGAALTAFLTAHGKTCHSLPGMPLTDIGTIFLI